MRLTQKILAALVLTVTGTSGVAFATQSGASLNLPTIPSSLSVMGTHPAPVPVVVACTMPAPVAPAVTLDPGLLISGDQITAVQSALGVAPADGVYGPATQASVAAFVAPSDGCTVTQAQQTVLDALAALTAAQDGLTTQAQAARAAAAAKPKPVVVAAPQPVQVASGPGPCSAPNLPLSWIAWCESGCNPTNHNPYSTAAGKYQVLTTTWQGYAGYATADQAPEGVQDAWAADAYASAGTGPWAASRGCWGGKW